MKRGLIIGKFMPVHKGHIALIQFAAGQCKELIVSMSYTLQDPIPHELRFAWLKEIFGSSPAVSIEMVLDDFDDDSLSMPERTKLWADFIRRRYPGVDALFSSEKYGDLLAGHLGVTHTLFDLNRNLVPVSATVIRRQPMTHWEFIPDAVRPYFVKKVCFYGPESTGKTTMAMQMAEAYQTAYVPEVAREIVSSPVFSLADIVKIGEAQMQRIEEKKKAANRILICDTDLITTEVYSQHYLGSVPPVLFEWERQLTFDRYFFFEIDVPWVADHLRNLGSQRDLMRETFRLELEKRKIPYVMVAGTWKEREATIRNEIDKMLSDQ